MIDTQVDAQKVIDSLLRQIAELSGRLAMAEALLEQARQSPPQETSTE